MAKKTPPPVQEIWMGEPVAREAVLPRLREIRALPPGGRVHYIFTAPFQRRSATMDCLARFVWIDGGDYHSTAAFDGRMERRTIRAGDILAGGNGAWDMSDAGRASFRGFSVVFHAQHIRLVDTVIRRGRLAENPFYHTRGPAAGTLVVMLEALHAVIRDVGHERDERCRALLAALMAQLELDLLDEAEPAGDAERLVARLMNYMQLHYHLPLGCADVCSALGVNRSYASAVFHRNTGQTMKAYLRELRMREAALLLAHGDMSVEKIARRCGFSGTSYFIKVFSAFCGFSPGEYRNRRRERTLSPPGRSGDETQERM